LLPPWNGFYQRDKRIVKELMTGLAINIAEIVTFVTYIIMLLAVIIFPVTRVYFVA